MPASTFGMYERAFLITYNTAIRYVRLTPPFIKIAFRKTNAYI